MPVIIDEVLGSPSVDWTAFDDLFLFDADINIVLQTTIAAECEEYYRKVIRLYDAKDHDTLERTLNQLLSFSLQLHFPKLTEATKACLAATNSDQALKVVSELRTISRMVRERNPSNDARRFANFLKKLKKEQKGTQTMKIKGS